MELKKYKYFLKDKPNNFVELEVKNEVFYPTATSHFLINAAKDNIKTSGNLLDLGCGIGIVGIAVYLNGVVEKLFASDISKNATILTKKNALSLNVPIEVICGDKLECWRDQKFDYILNDVSGISDEIAKHSLWFKNVPNNSGKRGADNTVDILLNAKKYLNKNGKLFFPIISLSDIDYILEEASSHYKNVKLLSRNEWFLPPELESKMDVLEDLKLKKYVNYSKKFGKVICYTDIYQAY